MVIQIDRNSGETLATYNTVTEASRKTGVVATNISKVLTGKRSSAGGFKWKSTEEPTPSTTYKHDLNSGTLQVDTYYTSPPHPDQVIEDHNIDTTKWKLSNFYSKGKAKGWLVTAQFLNIQKGGGELNEDVLERIIQKHIKPFPTKTLPPPKKSVRSLRIIFTDAHIGMDVSGSLYKNTWNREELFRRGDVMLAEAMSLSTIYGGFDRIDLIDLGDYLDGLDGKTVRKTHDLPQNMTNEEAFDAALEFKLYLTQYIVENIPHNSLHIFNECVDNHAGSFAYFVNSAFEKVVNIQYNNTVKVYTLTDFITHYNYGKTTFLLSHGKDGKDLKNGLPAQLNSATKDKIDEYLKHHNLYAPDQTIIFEKGDSHQQVIDHTTSADFFYHSYAAFSPSSAWVTMNYKNGRSGFNLMIVNKETGDISMSPKYF